MNPYLMQKQIRENANDLEAFCMDLKQWRIDMDKEERKRNTDGKELESNVKVRKLSNPKDSSNASTSLKAGTTSKNPTEESTSTIKSNTAKEKSKTDKEKPKTGKEKPKTDKEKSKTGKEKPKTDKEKPKTDKEKPKTDKEKPKTDKEKPETDKEKSKTDKEKPKTDKEKTKKSATIDYSNWDKYDAESECAKLEERSGEERSSDDSYLTDECDDSSIDLANAKKEKGNGYVKRKMWEKAIKSYSAAIKLYNYDPVFYANRALCYLKLDRFQACEDDCTKALKLDSTYVKALQRRAAAREALENLSAAHADLEKVLKLEPKNKESKVAVEKLEKKLEEASKMRPDSDGAQRPVSKFTMSRQKKAVADKSSLSSSQQKDDSGGFRDPILPRVVERSNFDVAMEVDEAMDVDVPGSSFMASHETSSQETSQRTSSQRTPTIKTVWPSGDDVELVPVVQKNPNQRSKKKLKRIQVGEAEPFVIREQSTRRVVENLEKDDKNIQNDKFIKTNKISVVEDKRLEENKRGGNERLDDNKRSEDNKRGDDPRLDNQRLDVQRLDNQRLDNQRSEATNTEEPPPLDFNSLPTPKTAVSFFNHWKLSSDSVEGRLIYLSKIHPENLSDLFKESLSTKVFSEILSALAGDEKRTLSAYDYLLGLSGVKRFGALVMFMSREDKKALFRLIDVMREDGNLEQERVDALIKIYEL